MDNAPTEHTRATTSSNKSPWLPMLAAALAILIVGGVGAGILLSRQNAAMKKTNVAMANLQTRDKANADAARARSAAATKKAAAALARTQAADLAAAKKDAADAKAIASRPRTRVVVVRPSYRPSQVTDLSAGLFCRDLKSMGYSASEASEYWYWYGQPANMDADGNGIPCETVY
jgi:hypothetical protein